MTQRIRTVILGTLILTVLAGLLAAEQAPLTERHRSWLEEEVNYIISPLEREVFLKLSSDRERDMFIEAFWRHRDPTPESSKNEFREEHARRLAHTDRSLGPETVRPGRKTDRGRIYIILGEPREIERFQGKGEIYNCEAWFYQGKEELGLPAAFYLLFFQKTGVGEYKLYSPASDGPMALIAGITDTGENYVAAYRALRDIDPSLASISVSLIPGEGGPILGRPSLVSDMLIQRIEAAPRKLVEDKYAQRFLDFRDRVEVEYSANYMDSSASLHVIRDPSGIAFVHYGIELQRLSVNQYQDTFATTLLLIGVVTTLEGKRVFQFDKSATIELSQAEIAVRRSLPLTVRDVFPLVPGEYRFSVLLKNEASKEFTSFESALIVPASGPGVRLSVPILGHLLQTVADGPGQLTPYRLGGHQVLSESQRIFLRTDTLFVAFQLLGPRGEAPDGRLRFEFFKENEPFKEITREVSGYASRPDIVEPVPLADFPPAHYRLRIVFLANGVEAVSAGEEFDVTPKEGRPRPWFLSKVLPSADDPSHVRVTGRQLLNLERFSEAEAVLAPLYAAKPEEGLAIELARIRMALRDYAQVERLLEPYLSKGSDTRYDSLVLAGRASQLTGRFSRAIELYEAAAVRFGTSVILLNAIGECHLASGRRREAAAAWEKSLSLSPEQPELRRKLEALKTGWRP